MSQIGQQIVGDGLAGKLPNDCTQFEFFVEADAMINCPKPVGRLGVFSLFDEDVASFAVSVVDDGVEQDDLLEGVAKIGAAFKGEVVAFGIVRDELLHGTDAVWPAAENGGRDEVPAQPVADMEGGDFALA